MYTIEQTLKSIDGLLNAKSIAVVGASSDPSKYGYLTLKNIIDGGFAGNIYPINPKADEILGKKAYPSLSDLPEVPDTMVMLIPAKFIAGVVREGGKLGVKSAIIVAGGFREIGRQDLEDDLLAASQEYGLRYIGPNIHGINYLPNKLNPLFFPALYQRGSMSIVAGSGTVANALACWAEEEGLGINAAITLGNQSDLCDCDFLEYFANDPNTSVIAVYIEGVKDGKRFLPTLRRVAQKKNVVVLKGGRTAAGLKSAASHTGALAGDHAVFTSACRQCGAAVVTDLDSFYDAAKTLALLPTVKGDRIVNISSSGGSGTLSSDEAETLGLKIPGLPAAAVEELKGAHLSDNATLANPLDLAAFEAGGFEAAARIVDKYDIADIINLNYGDPVPGGVEAAIRLRDSLKSQVVVTYFAGGELEHEGRIALNKAGIPTYTSPERAMRGVAAGAWITNYRAKRGL